MRSRNSHFTHDLSLGGWFLGAHFVCAPRANLGPDPASLNRSQVRLHELNRKLVQYFVQLTARD